jgi:hypothetical protein
VDALALLQRAEALGFEFTESDGSLMVSGPEANGTLVEELRASKSQLLLALRARNGARQCGLVTTGFDPTWEGVPINGSPVEQSRCPCCAGTGWWRLRAGCPWVCARCHPSQQQAAELEWSGPEAGADSFEKDPSPSVPPSSQLAPTSMEVRHG